LGFYYEENNSFWDTRYAGMERILVGIDLTNGLEDSITIIKCSTLFHQTLDYEGVPLKCGRCHEYGHLFKDYALLLCKKAWI